VSDAQLTGMLARQRVRNKLMADALTCITEIVREEQAKHRIEDAEWRRWQACIELADNALNEMGVTPQ